MTNGEEAPPAYAELATEQRNPASTGLDRMTVTQVLAVMAEADRDVIAALDRSAPALAEAAEAVARAIGSDHRLIILGAGTGGRLAVQEVSELRPTFGIDADAAVALVASGAPIGPAAVAASEDDVEAPGRALGRLGVGEGDVVIGIAASGRTPFVVAGLTAAAAAGAVTVGIANNPGTPVLLAARIPVLLDTGPEVLTGSTRLKAGTAQKIALNRITTAAMVRCGLVTDNHMTHLLVTNGKLRERAIRMTIELLGIDRSAAVQRLERAGWRVPEALREPLD